MFNVLIWTILEARAEICQKSRSLFGQWSFKKNCFWDLLTFNKWNKKIPTYTIIRTYTIIWQVKVCKVKTLWEGHKIWNNLPPVLTQQLFLLSSVKTSGRFFQISVAFSKKLDFTQVEFKSNFGAIRKQQLKSYKILTYKWSSYSSCRNTAWQVRFLH